MPAKKDFSQHALSIVEQVVGDGPLVDTPEKARERESKNSALPPRGQRGGKAGGKARAKKLSKEQRAEIAKIAAAARWKRG